MNHLRFGAYLFVLLLLIATGCKEEILPPDNEPPVAVIISPTQGQTFIENDTIQFAGSGTDQEDGPLMGNSLVWTSSEDGPLGTGTSFSKKSLSVNTHVITLQVTDSAGESDSASATITVSEAPPVKVLFLGSSYFYYNKLPAKFKMLAQTGGQKVIVDHHYLPAGYLDDHSESPTTEARINSQAWDYVLLQGVGSIMAFPDRHQYIFPPYVRHELKKALITLKQKIEANCSRTKMVYCMPWAFEDGTLWLPGYSHTYFVMQQLIYDNTLKFSDEVGFVIAPVGWAWNKVMKENTQLHYLFQSDFNHPSLRGSYLMACVIYSTLFLEETNGITYYAGVPNNEAEYFQSVASSIVLDDLDLWFP
jgi:hypothetical protein